jgi:preprotein translocase subunit SecG
VKVIIPLAILLVLLVLLQAANGDGLITTNLIVALAVLLVLLFVFRIGFRWLTRNVRFFDGPPKT